MRLQIGDAARGVRRHEIRRRRLADELLRCSRLEQCQVILERIYAHARAGNKLGCQKPRLLALRHVDLRMLPEHLVERRRPALEMPDDEEIGYLLPCWCLSTRW